MGKITKLFLNFHHFDGYSKINHQTNLAEEYKRLNIKSRPRSLPIRSVFVITFLHTNELNDREEKSATQNYPFI